MEVISYYGSTAYVLSTRQLGTKCKLVICWQIRCSANCPLSVYLLSLAERSSHGGGNDHNNCWAGVLVCECACVEMCVCVCACLSAVRLEQVTGHHAHGEVEGLSQRVSTHNSWSPLPVAERNSDTGRAGSSGRQQLLQVADRARDAEGHARWSVLLNWITSCPPPSPPVPPWKGEVWILLNGGKGRARGGSW